MITAPTSLETAAATALVRQLPSIQPLTATPAAAGAWYGQTAGAITASFVGGMSADFAVVLADADVTAAAAAAESPLLTVADMMRPALDAASEVLGAGVLGDVQREDAPALFDHEETRVFQLTAAGVTAGWFAIRRRRGAHSASAPQPSHDSVAGKLGRINDVEMLLTVEIGRTRMSVRDVLSLEPGQVVELDRAAGAPADVLLNGRLIAQGEIVVVDQEFAVRITTILDVEAL